MLPDDAIDCYLNSMFGKSEPGDSLHHLLVVSAKPEDRNAVGAYDEDKVHVTFCAIEPDSKVDPTQFAMETLMAVVIKEKSEEGRRPIFVALSQEVHIVAGHGPDERAAQLLRERRLSEHPDSFEATCLYAACQDGRRWVGTHFLTGQQAGTVAGPYVRLGSLAPDEAGFEREVVRRVVGISLGI